MKKTAILAMTAVLAGFVIGQEIPPVYSPTRTVTDQKITLKAWGSGTIAETDELAFEGIHSIRISTRNYFQGGLFALSVPVDTTAAYSDKTNQLRFVISIPTGSTIMGGSGTKGGPTGGPMTGGGVVGMGGKSGTGGQGNAGGNRNNRGGNRPGQGGMMGGGIQGMGGMQGMGGGAGSNQDPAIRTIRVVVGTTDGKFAEAYIPVTTSPDAKGWRPLCVPLQALSGFDKTNKTIKSVAISGDTTGSIYVGDVRIVKDSTPITVETNVTDLNLALGDEVELIAHGYAGSSVIKYQWNFGTTTDRTLIDAEGQVVKRKFRKPGEYTITVYVVDVFGLKTPGKATIKVKVNG